MRVAGTLGGLLSILAVIVCCSKTNGDPHSAVQASAGTGGTAASAAPASNAPAHDAGTSDVCASYSAPQEVGRMQNPALNEISGIAASRTRPGALFVHNDSGDSPRFFAIDPAGNLLLEVDLPLAAVRDCEDIAAGPGPAGPSVYLGDIGDNAARTGIGVMRDEIQVYRVAEPAELKNANGQRVGLKTVDTLRFKYPDRPHDAEALLVDPVTADVYIVSKEEDGHSSIFRAAAPLKSGELRTLKRVLGLVFGTEPLSGATNVTSGDIAPSGRAILIRTYSNLFLWQRSADQSVAQAFATTARAVPVARELQGEAVAFALDGRGYYTTSEKPNQPIYFSHCE